jgi:hypothetical protein
MLFDLQDTVATPGALAILKQAGVSPQELHQPPRHRRLWDRWPL